MTVRLACQAVMHPLALAASERQTSAAEISQMSRDLGLWHIKNFHQVADANLATVHHVQESQARGIAESAKHLFEISAFSRHGNRFSIAEYIRVDRCVVKGV